METWLKILLISIAAIVLVAAICIVIFIILKKRHKATILEEFPQLILSLGGKENIEDVDACMTRLRVTVKNKDLVGDEKAWKAAGALGLIIKDKGVQAIYGPKADVLKSNIQDILGM